MKNLFTDCSGASLVMFSLFSPLLFVLLAGGINYSYWLSEKVTIQNAADTAALTAAKELRLGSASSSTVIAAARSRAIGVLGDLAETAKITISMPSKTSVSVEIDASPPAFFGSLSPVGSLDMKVVSSAQSASTPTCLFALDPKGQGIVVQSAAINANGCATYSGAQKPDGLKVQQGTISAFQTCSAGGVQIQQGYVTPAAITDCPTITDPLASRAAPSYGSCDYYNLKVTSSTTLSPGVYCGGLQITNSASVDLASGVYVISGGKLTVNQNAAIQGVQVGFFLAGDQSQLDIDIDSSVNLVAPADGPMAGILFFEDRSAHPNHHHLLGSRNAPQLLGTLYFPEGQLSIGAPSPGNSNNQLATDIAACAKLNLTYPCSPPQANVGQYSAWTIIIANDVKVNFVVNLVLNTNYSASSIKPPPEISFKGSSLTQ